AKRADSPYTGVRSRAWLKIKCHLRQEFVIGGYTDPQGTRPYFGALHLGLYEAGRLVYVSKVGTGFDDRTLADLWRRLRPLARPSSPLSAALPRRRARGPTSARSTSGPTRTAAPSPSRRWAPASTTAPSPTCGAGCAPAPGRARRSTPARRPGAGITGWSRAW